MQCFVEPHSFRCIAIRPNHLSRSLVTNSSDDLELQCVNTELKAYSLNTVPLHQTDARFLRQAQDSSCKSNGVTYQSENR